MNRPGDPLSGDPLPVDRQDWPEASTEAGLFDLDAGAASHGDGLVDITGEVQGEPGGGRLKKSATAFRTISEVADELHVPQHVLRFWETRFPQVKPLKRGGGRRYYRPDDVGLLRRIADLLYIQGYTIKGVQRLLRDGDGTLQGDLPPPEVADQDGDEPVRPAPEQRAAAPVPEQRVEARVAPEVAFVAPAEAGATHAGQPAEATQAAEAGKLRAALAMVLAELENLRRHLPA